MKFYSCIFAVAISIAWSTTPLTAEDTGSNRLDSNAPANLIVIMTDEHNFRTLGCYRETMEGRQAYMWGDSVVETPDIDWIAKNGALCTSFYATTPVCSPSRASLITGLFPQKTPVVSNNIALHDNIISFAEILRRNGYATGYAGKWHLDGDAKPGWAPRRKFGFEDNRFMFNSRSLEKTGEHSEWTASRGTQKRPPCLRGQPGRRRQLHHRLSDRSHTRICGETQVRSVLLYGQPARPARARHRSRSIQHHVRPDQTYEKPTTFDKDENGLPSWGKKQKSGLDQSRYYGMIKCIDDNVGRLIEKLKSEQLLENTIVVFTSDHGDLRGEHHRQNKGVPYEGSSRIPFLAYGHNRIQPGSKIDAALGSVDFVPTILNLLNVQFDSQLDGRDASQLFVTGQMPDDWQDITYVRGPGAKNGWLMAVSDRHKLIVSSTDPPWFFDLERDPDEVANLVSHPAYRETIRQMARGLQNYCQQHEDPFTELPRIRSSIRWAITGKGPYKSDDQ